MAFSPATTTRFEAFVDAARTLAAGTGSANFTVEQVVSAAGQSRKSFYRYFAGKDDLVLALFAEECRRGAEILRAVVDESDDGEARLRAWIVGLFELMAEGDAGYVGLLVREHRRLGETRPDDMDRAVSPFVSFLADEIAAATRDGVVAPGDADRRARTVFNLLLGEIHDLVLGRSGSTSESAEHVWAFCWSGLAGPPSASPPSSVPRTTREPAGS